MAAPGNMRAAATSRSDWETPPALFELLDREFHFTLDAAASEANRKCERYLTEEEDALSADIFDHIVFCNPPYGRGLGDWIAAWWRWRQAGSTVVVLLPANTDTEWFAHLWGLADEIRFLWPRVNFVGSKSGNTGGSMVAVIRPHVAGFPLSPHPPRVFHWRWRR